MGMHERSNTLNQCEQQQGEDVEEFLHMHLEILT